MTANSVLKELPYDRQRKNIVKTINYLFYYYPPITENLFILILQKPRR